MQYRLAPRADAGGRFRPWLWMRLLEGQVMSFESLPKYELLLEARITRMWRRLKLILLWLAIAVLLTFGPLAYAYMLVHYLP